MAGIRLFELHFLLVEGDALWRSQMKWAINISIVIVVILCRVLVLGYIEWHYDDALINKCSKSMNKNKIKNILFYGYIWRVLIDTILIHFKIWICIIFLSIWQWSDFHVYNFEITEVAKIIIYINVNICVYVFVFVFIKKLKINPKWKKKEQANIFVA